MTVKMPHALFLERALAKGTTPYVLLETDRPDHENLRTLWFDHALETRRLDQPADVGRFFEWIEGALRDGWWVVGYFAYELGYVFERRLQPLLERWPAAGPLAWVGVFAQPVTAPSASGRDPFANLEIADELRRFHVDRSGPEITRGRYRRAVSSIQRHIADGETYQVNYTFKHRFDLEGRPEALFLALRERQRVAYSACLYDGERSVLSFSPELFLRRRGDEIRLKPMKGTAPRGASKEEDVNIAAWLGADEKNRAENVMIVDMVRNDLGRISAAGAVSVPALFEVERFETLHQMTSTIAARVDRATPWLDVMRALFPCASVTGAPKIRTMEIIADLETGPRGVYTGAIGYIAPSGEACFNIAIRTIVVDSAGGGELGIGSGVVSDSAPDAEYNECLLKGEFLTGLEDRFGLIETMRLDDGEVFLLDRHLSRLQASADHFSFAYDQDRVRHTVLKIARDRSRGCHRLRLVLSADGGIDVEVRPFEKPPRSYRVCVSGRVVDHRDEWLRHKTTRRQLYDGERRRALSRGFDEVVFVNDRGEVTEGAITNVFARIDGELFTPPLHCGLLAGTMRQELIEEEGCRERELSLADLRVADDVFVGNSVVGLIQARIHPS